MRAYERDIKPRIEEAYAGAGASMSSRRGLALERTLGDTIASAVAQQAQTAPQLSEMLWNRRLQGSQLAEQSINAPIEGARNILEIAKPFYDIDAQRSMANYQEWLRTRPENSPYNQLGLSSLGTSQLAGFNTGAGLDELLAAAKALGLTGNNDSTTGLSSSSMNGTSPFANVSLGGTTTPSSGLLRSIQNTLNTSAGATGLNPLLYGKAV